MVLKNKKLKRFSFLLVAFLSIALATFFVALPGENIKMEQTKDL